MTVVEMPWERIARAYAKPLAIEIVRTMTTAAPDDRPGWSPSMLVDVTGAQLQTVAYHVRHLSRNGVLAPAGTVQRRGAVEHYYRVAS